MTVRLDGLASIPVGSVRFVSDQVCYVFLGWMYAVTTDGGDSWSVWDADTLTDDLDCCDSHLTQEVDVRPNGEGRMTTKPLRIKGEEVRAFHTSDFGRTWIPSQRTRAVPNGDG
jgi:hypothetical protein